MVIYPREGYAEDLWRFGEPDLAVAMLDTDDDTYRQVMTAALAPTVLRTDERKSWGMALTCALGAVEVLSGEPRYTKRKKRLPESSLDEFWDTEGRDRDRRGQDGGQREAVRVAHGK